MFCLTREGNSCHVRNFLVGDYNQLCKSEYQSGKSHLRVCGLFKLGSLFCLGLLVYECYLRILSALLMHHARCVICIELFLLVTSSLVGRLTMSCVVYYSQCNHFHCTNIYNKTQHQCFFVYDNYFIKNPQLSDIMADISAIRSLINYIAALHS